MREDVAGTIDTDYDCIIVSMVCGMLLLFVLPIIRVLDTYSIFWILPGGRHFRTSRTASQIENARLNST